MIGVIKEIKVIRQRVMKATVLRKTFFKERTSGRRSVDEDSAMCIVWGEPGDEPPRQKEQQVRSWAFLKHKSKDRVPGFL